MSLAMAMAKQGGGWQGGPSGVGDPGLFSFIGKGLKAVSGLLPGPLGTIAKTAGGLLAPTPKPISVAKASIFSSPLPTSRPGIGVPTLAGVNIGGPSGVTIGQLAAAPQYPSSTGALVGAGGQHTPCASGYHYNKTTYYTKKYGVIQKGTVCVRNRRRNPLNPRALSRSMSRIKSAQKAVRCLQLFAGPAARAAAKGGGKRKSSCRSCSTAVARRK